MTAQLVLHDATLRALGAVLAAGRIAEQIAQARRPDGRGVLRVAEDLPVLRDALAADCTPAGLLRPEAHRRASHDLMMAIGALDADATLVSVYAWDEQRDGDPLRAAHLRRVQAALDEAAVARAAPPQTPAS